MPSKDGTKEFTSENKDGIIDLAEASILYTLKQIFLNQHKELKNG
jgi:hypothetical protein